MADHPSPSAPEVGLFGSAAAEALRWAAAVASRRGKQAGARAIFVGILLHGRKPGIVNSGRFLWDYFGGTRSSGRSTLVWLAQRGDDIAGGPKQPADELRWSDFTDSGRMLANRAFACARYGDNPKEISLRHLVGALLLGPGSAPFRQEADLTEDTGVNPARLAHAYVEFIGSSFPAELLFWRAWNRGVPEFPLAEIFEPHVTEALRAARFIAPEGVVGPLQVIEAICREMPPTTSPAFTHLRTIVKNVPRRRENTPNLDWDLDVRLDGALQRQFDFALGELPGGTAPSFWGRDLVAAAVLAGGTELEQFLREDGTSLQAVRDGWFEYVTREDTHRTREQWNAWWAFAKVPPPASPALSDAEAPSRGVNAWESLQPKARWAFSWAAASASLRDPGGEPLVTVADLFGGLISEGGLSPEAWLPQLAWERIKGPLGLREVPAFPDLADFPASSPEVHAANGKALQLGRSDIDDGDRLFLALFEPEEIAGAATIDPILEKLALDADVVLEAYEAGVKARGKASLGVAKEIARRRRGDWDRPRLDNDRVGGAIDQAEDKLNASAPARRFARLLTAKDVRPPIAVGLFGRWGSGKTFFMGLLRDHINRLSGQPGYVRNTVQIEFNAWHYQDTNLWATLAIRIFDQIAAFFSQDRPDKADEIRKELHQRLESSQVRREEADRRRRNALDRRSEAETQLLHTQALRSDLKRRSVTLKGTAAWNVLLQDEKYRPLRDMVNKTLSKQFGLDAAMESFRSVESLRQAVGDIGTEGRNLFAMISHRFNTPLLTVKTIVALILVTMTVLASGPVVEKLAALARVHLPDLSIAVVQVAGFISAAAAWWGNRAKQLRAAIGLVARVQRDLEEAESKCLSDDALVNLQASLAKNDQIITQATEEMSASEREIAAATAEIQRIDNGGLVYDFLKERGASASYVSQLGLISTIRADLEQLGVLLRDLSASGRRPVDRIILYVDDLDRCHPDKVVEVLQAVHLLLAFDLFNVVVGVDARWLERSLRREYSAESMSGPGSAAEAFSPQDYLEKIFQIPYALAPMDQSGFENLMSQLTQSRSEWRKSRGQRRAATVSRPGVPESIYLTDPAVRTGADLATVAQEPHPLNQSSSGAQDGPAAPVVSPQVPAPGVASTDDGEAVSFFEDHEATFIRSLHAFIERPRLAKRFVNIYRLLRVRADDDGESARFVGWTEAGSTEYRSALVLLAINVGHPKIGAKILAALAQSDEGSGWEAFLGSLARAGSLLDGVEQLELTKVLEKLQALGSAIPQPLAAYKRWAPRVACYSFDWHRHNPGRPADVSHRPGPQERAQA